MKIIWVSSFDDRIWKSSGQRLVSSFLNYSPDGKLLCTTEKCENITFPTKECLYFASIDNHSWLELFKSMNKEVIPVQFGGTANACRCKNDKRHKTGCHWTWWNRNCFRWYRKFVSLKYARITWPKADYLIWVDSDCYFKGKNFNETYIHDILFDEGNYDCFYLKGPERAVMETGLIGYNLRQKGGDLLDTVVECYQSKKFRSFQRWDDCYVTQKHLKNYNVHDIAGKKGQHSEVFTHSLVGQFIHHNKGQHGRIEGIFK